MYSCLDIKEIGVSQQLQHGLYQLPHTYVFSGVYCIFLGFWILLPDKLSKVHLLLSSNNIGGNRRQSIQLKVFGHFMYRLAKTDNCCHNSSEPLLILTYTNSFAWRNQSGYRTASIMTQWRKLRKCWSALAVMFTHLFQFDWQTCSEPLY